MLFSMNLAMLKMLSLFSHFGGRTLYIGLDNKFLLFKFEFTTKNNSYDNFGFILLWWKKFPLQFSLNWLCFFHQIKENVNDKSLLQFFLNIFWCAPFGYLYFQFFFNVIASKSLTSIQDTAGDSNPKPFGSESSALTTRPGFSPQLYFCLTQLLTLP